MVDLSTHFLDASDLPKRFLRFAERETLGLSPLYETLARAGAGSDAALAIAAERQSAQPPVNIVLAGAHLLLLRGDQHPLRAFYPNLTEAPESAAKAGPAFLDFVETRREALIAIARARRVSTNEPGRMAALLCGVDAGLRAAGGANAIGLVDIGASAGLNLRPDRARFAFGDGRFTGAACSPLLIETELTPPDAPAPAALPDIVARIGIDPFPLDPTDEEDALWLRALIWPDAGRRFARLDGALALAQAEPAQMIRGDAAADLARAVDRIPAHALAVVTHSITLYQLRDETRAAFEDALRAVSCARPVLRASLEWARGEARPHLASALYRDGAPVWRKRLGDGDPHGGWIALGESAENQLSIR